MSAPPSLREMTGVSEVADGTYRAEPFFDRARVGNAHPIAYGGFVLSQTVSAGWATIPQSSQFDLFSVQGTYLGPASTDVPTTFAVEDLRTTRTFCTRLITATQRVDGGVPKKNQERRIFVALLDWHVKEQKSMFKYHNPPSRSLDTYGRPESLPRLVDSARLQLSSVTFQTYNRFFGLFPTLFDVRACPNSVAHGNFYGLIPENTPDSSTPITENIACAWHRSYEKLNGPEQQSAASAFLLDAALAFIPLSFTGRDITAAAAVSSLTFTLQFYCPADLSDWRLLEQRTERGCDTKTHSVGSLYTREGVEVARMTQASIMRPHRSKL